MAQAQKTPTGGNKFTASSVSLPEAHTGAYKGDDMDRRNFLNLAALGGSAIFASALPGCAGMQPEAKAAGGRDFYFVQLSDSHWGYKGPDNPDAAVTLRKTVATVNALETQPEFIVFTGDLSHTTDDPGERRRRLAEFKSIVADLKATTVRFMPGEQ